MASVFRRRGDSAYTIAWMDAQGRRREKSSGTPDKKAATMIAGRIDSSVVLRREGIIDARQDRLAAHVGRPLLEHVRSYVQHCLDAEQARVTVAEKLRHISWLMCERDWRALLPEGKRKDWAPNASTKPKDPAKAKKAKVPPSRRVNGPGWKYLTDMTPESLERALALLRENGLGARACNYRREAAVAFAEWCVKSNRLESNVLRTVRKLDAARDQRRVRRALTDEELARLFEAAEKRGRKLWYQLASLAGLRRSEIASLTWADVDLTAGSLTIVRGKAKRTDVLPLHPDLRTELERARPALSLPTARVFPAEMSNETRRRDFKRAKIAEVDEDGAYADLHALRTTFGTNLGRAGVAPQIAARLMRHTDYRLTLRHYVRLTLDDSAAALSKLAPIVTRPTEDEQARKTGTDEKDAPSSPSDDWPQKRPHSGHETARSGASGCGVPSGKSRVARAPNPASIAGNRDGLRAQALAHPEGFEPTTLGSEDRYSIR